MRRRFLTSLAAFIFSAPIFILIQANPANASCRDYPESVTPACVAQNLAEEQARQAAEEARRAKEIADAEKRAQDQAQRDFVANGSRECSVYPASITASCIAENLADAQTKEAAEQAKRAKEAAAAEDRAKEQAEADFIENGSRECSIYPASITAECVVANLAYEAKRQVAQQKLNEKRQQEAEERALKQAQEDFIRNGSRPCSLYPASISDECVAENLEYEDIKKIEIAALTEARETSTKSLITTKDENGSLLVASIIPKGVDLLTTRVRLLNSKGKLVDNGEIRYDSAGRPYFVFDKQVNKGNYKIELTIPKKKAATIAIKL